MDEDRYLDEHRDPFIEKTHKGNRLTMFLRCFFGLCDSLIGILSFGLLTGNIHFKCAFEWDWFQELEIRQAMKAKEKGESDEVLCVSAENDTVWFQE